MSGDRRSFRERACSEFCFASSLFILKRERGHRSPRSRDKTDVSGRRGLLPEGKCNAPRGPVHPQTVRPQLQRRHRKVPDCLVVRFPA